MTEVAHMQMLEDCFESSVTWELTIDQPFDELLMRRLAEGGKLDFHPEFPRPYFRISQPSAWIIQGVIGNKTFRVTGMPSFAGDPASNIKCLIEQGEPDNGSKTQAIL